MASLVSTIKKVLFFEIEKILKNAHPYSFILENVSGIRFNGGGKYPSLLATEPQFIGKSMKFLEENLAKLKNYHIKWQEIDSSQLGSPQVRKRVYIVGIHKDFTKELILQFRNYKPSPFISIVDEQIIEELEPTRRGLYGGIVGYIDFRGNLDSAIAIRTALIKDGIAYVQAGAGVVADSVAESEEQECVNKAAAVLSAIATANSLRKPL